MLIPDECYEAGKDRNHFDHQILEKTLSSLSNGILVYDLLSEKTVFINKHFSKITGYTFEDMTSLSEADFLALVHPEQRTQLLTHWRNLETLQDDTEQEIEYRLRTKRGTWIWCLSRDAVLARDEAGKASHWVCALLDITQRKDLERRLTDQIQTLDAASIVAETDLSGRITYVNDSFCEISKYSRQELIGHTHRIINSGAHPREFFENLWKTISGGSVWKGAIKNRARDGTYYWVDTTIMPFKDWDGRIYKYVSVRHDITKEKEYLEQLEEQIEVATRALSSAESKGKFIGEMSHEVRNNLNCILGFSQLLLEGEGEEEEEIADFLIRIKKASEQTLGLMNNVLDAVKLDSPNSKLNEASCSLRELITDVVDISLGGIRQKGLHLHLELAKDLPTFIWCDSLRLKQILLNLLSNAAKYTDEGHILLEVKRIDDPSNSGSVKLRFSVVDTGRGIPQEKLSTLFREFEQCSPRDASHGTGLGLSLCKRAVELMAGKIWAESDGHGSRFTFEITFKTENQPQETRQQISNLHSDHLVN